MDTTSLLQEYAAGPELLAESVAHVSPDLFDEVPIRDAWSIRQVICHLADAEIIYADRIKRILIEDNPTLCEWSPDDSITNELCLCRDIRNELTIINSIRRQIESMLTAQEVECWQRTAVHTEDGPMTLETVVQRITLHIPHHVNFIKAKSDALGIS